MEKEKLFEVKDLRISARNDDGEEVKIVKGVTFDIHKGEVVALIGESGSGKTTISLATLAYTKPGLYFSGGECQLYGKDVLTMPPLEQRELRGGNVAYLAQSAAATFNPAITIGEQVTESAVLHGRLTQEQATERAVELYHALELPDADRIGFRYPHQVSGGQLQRLMAAMALCGKPDLMVLDEPTTALDEDSAAIYVTHDLAVVAQVADHIVVLYGGEVMEQGSADQIINNPQHAYTKRLMEAVRPKPEAGQGVELTHEHHRDIDNIEVRGMTAGYGGIVDDEPVIPILKDINVSVRNGHVVGVIGESGCGKSTLARVMAGMLPPARGDIILDGKKLEGALKDRKLDELQKVQFVFQMADTALNPKQLIGNIIGRPLEFYHGLTGREKHAKVSEILEMVELPPAFASRYPMELSGGQKQRINLARSLAANPEVMLCDEVTSALDSIVGANVIKLLTALRDKTGVSFVFISHDLSTVSSFADEIVVLYAGRVVEQGPTDEVLEPPFHPYTRLLISSVPEMRIGWLEDTMQKREMAVGIARGVEITKRGCPFFNRCPLAIEGTCETHSPPTLRLGNGHEISCHLTLEQLQETERETQKILHGFEKLGEEDPQVHVP
jgi:peptide/nickel transport system ATP-binding protein